MLDMFFHVQTSLKRLSLPTPLQLLTAPSNIMKRLKHPSPLYHTTAVSRINNPEFTFLKDKMVSKVFEGVQEVKAIRQIHFHFNDTNTNKSSTKNSSAIVLMVKLQYLKQITIL